MGVIELSGLGPTILLAVNTDRIRDTKGGLGRNSGPAEAAALVAD
jgi:hypothetical protein